MWREGESGEEERGSSGVRLGEGDGEKVGKVGKVKESERKWKVSERGKKLEGKKGEGRWR